MKDKKTKAVIALEDGTLFEGYSFGSPKEKTGELVFNTGMTGYQEILTDPSYKGQIVMMTYPLIGNYGTNNEDMESSKIHLEGFVVKELSKITSNWRATENLSEFLNKYDIPGIEGVDTRSLTRHIRDKGAMKAIISTSEKNIKKLLLKLKKAPGLIGRDLVSEVTSDRIYTYKNEGDYKITVIDCGVKTNILRELAKRNCSVVVVPSNTNLAEIEKTSPDGILISNGPGDPSALPYLIDNVKELIKKYPVFGICLGHQIICQALGGKTYKLKFGHHGCNHPVKDLKTGKIIITVQNHGFCVDIDSLDKEVEITHINLNDGTLEGIIHKILPVFSVQFHPEASPGPEDAKYLFDEFIDIIERNKKNA